MCVCLIRQQKNNNQEFFFCFLPAAVAAVSDIADQANDSLKDGVSVGLSGLAYMLRGIELRTLVYGIFKPDQLQ